MQSLISQARHLVLHTKFVLDTRHCLLQMLNASMTSDELRGHIRKATFFYRIRDHPFKTSACLRGGGVSPCADGQKSTVHKDQKSPSQAFCWNADGRGIGVKNRENLPTS